MIKLNLLFFGIFLFISCTNLFVLVNTMNQSTILYYHGNELQQAIRYFKLNQKKFNYSQDNINNYLHNVKSCENTDDIEMCMISYNNELKYDMKLWEPKEVGKPNCQYKVNSNSNRVYINKLSHSIQFVFTIRQYNCLVPFPQSQYLYNDTNMTNQNKLHHSYHERLLGGSSFEIFLYNSEYLTSCHSYDHFNNLYTIFCNIHLKVETMNKLVFSNWNLVQLFPMSVTLILLYEHFDAFSEQLRIELEHYPSLRHVLLDNATMYFHFHKKSLTHLIPNIRISNKVTYRSGQWIANERLLNMSSSWYNREKNKQFLTKLSFPRNHLDNYKISSTFRNTSFISKIIPVDYPDVYNFQPISTTTISNTNTNTNTNTNSNGNGNGNGIGNDIGNGIGNGIGNTNTINKSIVNFISSKECCTFTNVKDALLSNTSNKYIIVLGASHMRYNYDSLIEFIYNDNNLKYLKRKHSSTSLRRIRYGSFQFISNLIVLLEDLCQSNVFPENPMAQYDVIFHFGPWDLLLAPLRRLLESQQLSKLIQTLTNIIFQQISCPYISQLIYITTLPYPICQNIQDKEGTCFSNRGYQTNPSINLMNQYMIRNIMSLINRQSIDTIDATKNSSYHPVKLTIIDGNMIMKPRLAWNEEYELICGMHYLCRPDLEGDGNVSEHMYHTPSGNALFQTILLHLATSIN